MGYEDDVSLLFFLAFRCFGAIGVGEWRFETICDCGLGVFEGDEFGGAEFESICCVAYEFAVAVVLMFFDSEVARADFGLPVFTRDSWGDADEVEGV